MKGVVGSSDEDVGKELAKLSVKDKKAEIPEEKQDEKPASAGAAEKKD